MNFIDHEQHKYLIDSINTKITYNANPDDCKSKEVTFKLTQNDRDNLANEMKGISKGNNFKYINGVFKQFFEVYDCSINNASMYRKKTKAIDITKTYIENEQKQYTRQ